jgi:hypothetical protein
LDTAGVRGFHRVQAGICDIVFDEPYEYGTGLEEAYRRLIAVRSGMRLRQRPPR